MKTVSLLVNNAASTFLGYPVKIGYTNGGYPVVRDSMDEVLFGGMDNVVPVPAVLLNLISAQAVLVNAIEALELGDGFSVDEANAEEEANLESKMLGES